MKRIGALFLCVAMLWLLAACRESGQQPVESSSEKTEEQTQEQGWELLFAENGECNYDIVCPANANENMVKVCQKLANNIKKYTNAIVRVVFDDIAAPSAHEILVGPTNRPESAKALEKLRYRDYSVSYAGEKIVLAGAYDGAAVNAANWFIDHVLEPQGEAERVVLRASDTCTVSADYPVAEMLLPGGGVDGYSIVIPEKSSISEFRTAKLFQLLLADKTGYLLPIRSDAEESDLEILIGNTARTKNAVSERSYRISASGKRLELHASSVFGWEQLMLDLEKVYWKEGTQRLTWDGQTDIHVDITERLTDGSEHIYERSGDIRVMYSNVLGGCDANVYPHEQRNRMLAELMLEYLPDVIGLQECNAKARAGEYGIISCLTASGAYAELAVESPAVNCTPLLYRPDRLEVVSSGYHAYADGANDASKGVTWAVFRIRENGKLFAAMSTHFAWNKTSTPADNAARLIDARELLEICEQIRSKYEGIGIVVGGDYNCNLSSEPYALLTEGGMLDVQALAESTEDRKTWHAYPEFNAELGIYDKYSYPSGKYESGIDHIMTLGGDLSFHTFDIVTDRYALLSADHCPMITEFTIN